MKGKPATLAGHDQLIKAVVDVMRPTPEDTLCDPAAGTGGFLILAHKYVLDRHGRALDPDQKRHLRREFARGWELVPNTGRLCIMNLYLHGIDADPCPIRSGVDALQRDPGEHFSLVMTNPPFGKKSSISIVGADGDIEKEDIAYERADFWTTTKNKQLKLPSARQDAAEDQRPLRHRRSRQRALRGRRR